MSEILKINDLYVRFYNAAPGRIAVDKISLTVNAGEIVGLVGESGSGKTVTTMCISGLLDKKSAEIGGSITLVGEEIFNCSEKQMVGLQGDEISVVFQEPMTAMNPVMKVGPQIEESLRTHTKLSKAERKARALEAMREAEVPMPEKTYEKYPHELSGGMLQRAMIAAAIINRPQLLLADEPTTALDVTVQAQIIELLKKLNRETGMAILFISHDLNVVRKLCTRVAVMQRGHIVETGSIDDIFNNPQNDYTKNLIASIPTRDRRLV